MEILFVVDLYGAAIGNKEYNQEKVNLFP